MKQKITKHREKILKVLREWFQTSERGPTLEELCVALGMQPKQKATVQRWLQTMRGIDVEWIDNVPRSFKPIEKDLSKPEIASAKETLRYLASAIGEWERRELKKRGRISPALHLGMSKMYLASLIQGEEVPQDIPQLFKLAQQPIVEWLPSTEQLKLSPYVTLIEDGTTSDFARLWQVEGIDVEKQVQEKVLQDVLEKCRYEQNEDAYRAFRKLIIEHPVIPIRTYQQHRISSQSRPLRDLLDEAYDRLDRFAEDDNYHLCPRCQYVQRQRHDGTYTCRNPFCERLRVKLDLPPLPSIPKNDAMDWKVVKPGIYLYGTLPGIWELKLAEELRKLGFSITLWPEVDKFDLLVEFGRKIRWAIDVKDWSGWNEEWLKQVNYRFECQETWIVFPNEREEVLQVKEMRKVLEPELSGVRLKLMSEVIDRAKSIVEKKHD